jgi:DNA-directed RNA polymerase subunit RPC12/RpoP
MELTAAKCPECGAELKIPEGKDVVVCDYCGSSVIVKDLAGRGNNIENYLSLAKSALQGGSLQEAYDYYNKVLELSGADADAWFGKAVCAGGMTGLNDIKLDEMLVCFDSAIKNTKEEQQDEIKKKAAVEINKAVMNAISNVKNRRDIIFNPHEGGGFSVEIGNILANAKRLADESLKALQKAHELDPGNKEVSDNISNLSSQIKKTGSFIDTHDVNLQYRISPAQIPGSSGRKSTHALLKLIFLILIIIGGYIFIKNYANKDKTVSNLINEFSKKIDKVNYDVVNMISQNGVAYVSVYTAVNSDEALLKINKDIINKYNSKNKIIYVNYYSDKNSASKNSNLQSKHNKDWISRNAQSINIIATLEYDVEKQQSKFYKYVDGGTVDIDQTKN